MSKILDTAAVNAKINGIKQSAANIRENVHVALVAIVGHALKYGSSPLGTRLIAVTGGVNQTAIAAWLEKNGPFVVDRQAREVVFAKKVRAEKYKAYQNDEDIEAYLDELDDGERWYETSAAQKIGPAQAFDIEAALKALVKKGKKKAADTDGPGVVGEGLLSYLEGAVAKFHSDMALAEAQRQAAEKEAAEREAAHQKALEELRNLEALRANEPGPLERDEAMELAADLAALGAQVPERVAA